MAFNGGEQAKLTRGDLIADVGATDYTRRGAAGESVRTLTGTSLSKVIELAGVPADTVSEVQVHHAIDNGVARVTRDQLLSGFHGDPLGPRVALVSGSGGTVSFVRPLIDDEDSNGGDWIDVKSGGDLAIDVTTENGAPRTVTASASDDTPEVGEDVQFNASVQDGGAVGFRYTWHFDDGTASATEQAPVHHFRAGHYSVTVTATGDDGSVGISKPIELQVGTVKAAPTATATPTPDRTGGPSTGDGNGAPGSGGGGPSGGGRGQRDEAASGRSRTRGRSRGDSSRGRTPSATATPSAPTPTATATATPHSDTTTITRSNGSTSKRKGAQQPDTAQADEQTGSRSTPTTGAPRTVDGVLLAGSGSAAEIGELLRGVEAQQPAGERAVARRGGGGGSDALAPAGGTAAVLLLLALGALRESGRRPRLPRLRA